MRWRSGSSANCAKFATCKTTYDYGKGSRLHPLAPRRLRRRVVRGAAHSVDQRADGTPRGYGALCRTSGGGARQGRCRPRRGDAHRGESGGLRREDRRPQGQNGAGLRPLRRDAGRSARGVDDRAVRTRRARRPHLGARSRRRQGAVVHAHQGVRGDVRDRTTALQREVHARRRRGDRFAESLQILPRAEETAEIGCHSGLRYVDDFDGYTFDYLRVAWFNLYAGRGDGTGQGFAFWTFRRCGGQSGQRAGAAGRFAGRRRGARDDSRILRRRARTVGRRTACAQQGAVPSGRLQAVAAHRRRGGRSGLYDHGAYGRAPVARRERHLGRLYRGGNQDDHSGACVGQDLDAAGAESGFP